MLFLLKRTGPTAAAALTVLLPLGLVLRRFLPDPPPVTLSLQTLLTGTITCGLVLFSDGVIHGTLLLTFRNHYWRKYWELVEVFRGQTAWAILTGALLAGVGEELLFRGLSHAPVYLGTAA